MLHLTNPNGPPKSEIMKDLNGLRKDNKGEWYSYNAIDDKGRLIEAKGFNTWLQVFRINGVSHSCPMDCPVKAFNNFLNQAIGE